MICTHENVDTTRSSHRSPLVLAQSPAKKDLVVAHTHDPKVSTAPRRILMNSHKGAFACEMRLHREYRNRPAFQIIPIERPDRRGDTKETTGGISARSAPQIGGTSYRPVWTKVPSRTPASPFALFGARGKRQSLSGPRSCRSEFRSMSSPSPPVIAMLHSTVAIGKPRAEMSCRELRAEADRTGVGSAIKTS